MIHLVCGGNGFIGRNLVAHLRSRRPADTVETLDRPCDLADGDAVREAVHRIGPDRVYHVAGSARVNDNAGLEGYFRSNFLTTTCIADACEGLGKPVDFFLASSVHVYGNQAGVIDEAWPVHPASLYSFSKYLAEEALRRTVARAPKIRGVVGRLYTCIGPGQGPGFVAADFCGRLAALPAQGGKFKTGPLSPFRRFVDVRDAVAAIDALLETPATERLDVFNIASPHEVTVRQLLDMLVSLSGKTPQIEEAVGDANSFQGLRLATGKLERIFPATRFRALRETLREMYEQASAAVRRPS